MAAISQFNHFPCNILSFRPPPNSQSTSTSAILPLCSINTTISISKSRLVAACPIKPRPHFLVRSVVNDEEWSPEEVGSGPAVALDEEQKPKDLTEIDSLKKQLVDSFYGTNGGLNASSETRAEIFELISQLEAKNPTPALAEALTLLNGKWILAYTSFSDLFPLLSRVTLPWLKVEEISETIDSETFSVQNSVQFSGPLATTSISTNAKFEVQSPKRVQIKFEEGIIGTPQLTDSLELPENVEFLGQKIDLTPIKGLLTLSRTQHHQ